MARARRKTRAPAKPAYDCLSCPAYCCTYEEIPVTMRDLRRLAKRFGIDAAVAEKRFTKRSSDGTRIMRHQHDDVFPSACRFLDTETRKCTVYEHRPEICRGFPDKPRCGYWDFMMWERAQQDDDEFIPVVS